MALRTSHPLIFHRLVFVDRRARRPRHQHSVGIDGVSGVVGGQHAAHVYRHSVDYAISGVGHVTLHARPLPYHIHV